MFFSGHGWEILLIITVIGIIAVGIYRNFTGKQGTWTENLSVKQLRELVPGENNKATTPVSTESKGEQECRRVLQMLYRRPFTKQRPKWLNNSVTNNNLELDCFNDELKLAVEYQGRQHYEFIPFFHKTKEHFRNGQYRDDMKRRLCRDNGVRLVEVPYTVKTEHIEEYLRRALSK